MRELRSISGHKSIITVPIALRRKILSPLTLNTYQSDKVGLGIVAAMDKSDSKAHNWIFSAPIPVTGGNNTDGEMEAMEDGIEEYTYVTRHGGGRFAGNDEFHCRSGGKKRSVCLFHISPARFEGSTEERAVASDFLRFCYRCRKKLDGEDVYMYRGEKAFCSFECRNCEISKDERNAKFTTSKSRSPHISSSSPYTYNHNRHAFSPEIIAI